MLMRCVNFMLMH